MTALYSGVLTSISPCPLATNIAAISYIGGRVEFGGSGLTQGVASRMASLGVWGAFFLAVLFAISFCPTSAAWSFGLLAFTLGSDAGAITQVMQGVGIDLPEAAIRAAP